MTEVMSVGSPGTVYWFTGLSGAGKTTLGRLFHARVRNHKANVVYCDGDTLRDVFGQDLGHSLDDRLQLAMRYARLCRMLAEQGIDVVCATISMFHQVRRWNREHFPAYREIYIQVPLEVLVERDQKGLYSRALKGEAHNVIGVDLPFEAPENPDVRILNDGSRPPDTIVDELIQALSLERELA